MTLDLAAIIAGTNPEAGDSPARFEYGQTTAVDTANHRASVNLGGSVLPNLPCLTSYVPEVGQVVAVLVDRGRALVLGTVSVPDTTPPVPELPPDPPSQPVTGTNTFPATDAATYRGSGWRSDTSNVIQGDWTGNGINTGAWFYGTVVADSLPGVTVTGIEVYLRRQTGGVNSAQAAGVKGHAMPSRAGAPTFTVGPQNVSLAVGNAGWYALPTSWGQQMVAGTLRGVGIQAPGASPYVVLAGLPTDGQSGALRISWSR